MAFRVRSANPGREAAAQILVETSGQGDGRGTKVDKFRNDDGKPPKLPSAYRCSRCNFAKDIARFLLALSRDRLRAAAKAW